MRTRVLHPTGHTRLPRYARGKPGTVERVHGAHVLPDSNAHGHGERPEWLYSVRFSGAGAVGRGGRPDADRRHRRLGELPGQTPAVANSGR